MTLLPIVQQALLAGFGEEQILNFISKRLPQLASGISRAKGAGFDPSKILRFLSYSSPKRNKKQIDEQKSLNDQYLSSIGLRTKEEREARTRKILQGAIGIGAGALGLYQLAKPLINKIGPTPMANAPVQPDTAQIPIAQPSIPQTTTQQQLSAPVPQTQMHPTSTSPQIDSENILKEMGIDQQVKNLKERGNDVQEITAAANSILKPHQKKWLEGKIKEGKASPLNELVEDFISKTPQEKSSRPKELIKNDIVATPSGEVGTLKDLRKKEGLVEEGGKLHKVKISDLQGPNESVVQTVSRLLEIPEIDKSALINYWSYDPESKELFLMFHNGETYKYLDVPEELEDELLESSVSPKTQGQNQFGAWSQEDPMSRGATFIQKLISHSKYKRTKKGEVPNPFYRKLRKGYDYWQKLRS